MNIAVTGGTGFIGSALCKRLLADGYAVTVLTRDRRRAQQQFKGPIRLIESLKEPVSYTHLTLPTIHSV